MMNLPRLPLTQTLESLPPEWPEEPLPAIQSALRDSGRKLLVLDDDPTGTQTVHGLPVLTDWSVDAIVEELGNDLPTFYVLTNSRSMPVSKAQELHREIGRNIVEAERRSGTQVTIASRGDSTLRGHFPEELDALVDALGQQFDAWIIAPFFFEGGRYTLNDVHYVAEGDSLVPAAETEFARDPAFGYRSSDLREWVEEKTQGRVKARDVASISIEDIRQGGPSRVAERLGSLPDGSMCIVNAASMRDLEVFTQGLLEVERQGRRFLLRTAASLIRARSGLGPHPLLTKEDMDVSGAGGGLIIIGSYVPRTTAQLTHTLENTDCKAIEISVADLLSDERCTNEIERVVKQVNDELGRGDDVVVYTSRELISGRTSEESFSIGQRVSGSVVEIVRNLSIRPRYLLAKGGSTSSDIATEALNVKRAIAPGQILPGVPVWDLGTESRYPGLKYIIFPGNVGEADAITQVVTMLKR